MTAQLNLFDVGNVPARSTTRGARSARTPSQGSPSGPPSTPLPLGHVSSRQFAPVRKALEGASRYTGGHHSIEGLEHVQADRPRAFAMQAAYKAAEGAPEQPGIRRSYAALAHETNAQYEHMTRPAEQGGMGLHHEVTEHDPYASAAEMGADVAAGRIKTLATSTTGPHNFFSNETNDRFRAVHDVFGHAATGRGFSRNGEEAAYLSHRQMFSKKAGPAMASETRGQNSYLNYGQTQGQPGKSFPDQSAKLIGLPKFAMGVSKKGSSRVAN